MVQASVGFHCPECVKRAAKASPTVTARSIANRPPVVTYALIALNAVAFLAVLAGGGTITDGGGRVTLDYGLVGAGYTSANSNSIVGVAAHQWYRLFTGAFLHAGIIHLGMNMLVLWLIGTQLERALGAVRYIVLYVVSLAAGAFAVMLVDPNIITVGASGAIFGLMGAAAAFQRSRGINLFQSGLAGLIILNLVISFTIPGISVAGHIGGLIGGLGMGWLAFEIERRTRSEWPVVALGIALTAALTLAGMWAAHSYLVTGHPLL
jgi:membrane associated rhomboid family serine protease